MHVIDKAQHPIGSFETGRSPTLSLSGCWAQEEHLDDGVDNVSPQLAPLRQCPRRDGHRNSGKHKGKEPARAGIGVGLGFRVYP